MQHALSHSLRADPYQQMLHASLLIVSKRPSKILLLPMLVGFVKRYRRPNSVGMDEAGEVWHLISNFVTPSCGYISISTHGYLFPNRNFARRSEKRHISHCFGVLNCLEMWHHSFSPFLSPFITSIK